MEKATIYALDSFTIGITGQKIKDRGEISAFQETIPLMHEEGIISLKIPDSFHRFYHLDRKHYVVTINSKNILITVLGEIIESLED